MKNKWENMTEELEKEAKDFESRKHYRYEDNDYCGDIADGIIQAYIAGAEPREKRIEELEAQLTLKITSCIKTHLCKQDEDYDRPTISPKFLSDILDQMIADGFEGEIKEK